MTAGPGWEKVTLEHLLTMTAGLDWEPQEILRTGPEGPELFDEVLGRRVVHQPGSRWLYKQLGHRAVGRDPAPRVTGMYADELAAQTLFAPLGITAWDWEGRRSEGYQLLAGALHLRPIDMAKIGQLVLDGGRWQGRQVYFFL